MHKEQYIPIINETIKGEAQRITQEIFIAIIIYYLDIQIPDSLPDSPRSELSQEFTPRSQITDNS